MPPTAEPRAAALGGALAALRVRIDEAAVRAGAVDVAGYPGRPTAVVRLAGAGHAGTGEHVGWSAEAHAGFARRAAAVARGTTRVADFAASLAGLPAYDRAALEAAAVDLALRQAGATPAALLGATPAPVRYVVSLGATPEIATVLAAEPAHVELKLDVHPAWTDGGWAALAARGGIAVLDWKGGGDAAAHARAARALPAAWHEDPAVPDAVPADRLAADAPLTGPAALGTLPVPPRAVNVKPARTGGLLAALALAADASARGLALYLGGMWEVGPGRRQLLVLAALLAPDGPNDIAPLAVAGAAPARPVRLVPPAAPGLG